MPALRSRRVASTLAFALIAAAVALCAATAVSRAASSSAVSSSETPGTWCGGTLWRLMTLSDGDRARVNLRGAPTTIAQIAALAPPKRIVAARKTAFQRQVWRLRAIVDRYRIASNGEIVLILYSIDTAQYMDVYLPNPVCLGPRARERAGMIAARREFTSHCPTVTAAWQLLGVTVDLTGVGFWNPSTNTRGALANGAELRPITKLAVVSGCGVG
jgi:hypothetical protein